MLKAGEVADPFLARTLPPLPASFGGRGMVVARSRRNYAMARPEVEAKIARWLAPRAGARASRQPHRRYVPEEIVEAVLAARQGGRSKPGLGL